MLEPAVMNYFDYLFLMWELLVLNHKPPWAEVAVYLAHNQPPRCTYRTCLDTSTLEHLLR